MTFRIGEVLINGEWIKLSRDDIFNNYRWENMFTLVVGENATGKSRLLRKIVSNYIFDTDTKNKKITLENSNQRKLNEYDPFSDREIQYETYSDREQTHYASKSYSEGEIRELTNSEQTPANVIAVSTGRHDRFPSPTLSSKNSSDIEYHYIGVSGRGNAISSFARSLTAILEGLLEDGEKFHSLADIFLYLGFMPYLDFKFSTTAAANNLINSNEHSSDIPYNVISSIPGAAHWTTYEYRELIDDLIYFKDVTYKRSGSRFEIDLTSTIWGFDRRHFEKTIKLLKAGLITVSDIALISINQKARLRLSQTSSGQQCMLTMILGIAGAIKHGSLVCIDEPEISLHPKWQSDIVRQLQTAFQNYEGCHFIIATHSPQIVAGLTTDNGYILNLEDKTLYDSNEYSRRSADFQLAEVFNAPGYSNEYLIRICLSLLTKVTKEESLSFDDSAKLHSLLKIKKNLSENDPVRHLINQLDMLAFVPKQEY